MGQARALRTKLLGDDALATKAVERIGSLIQGRTSKGCIPRPELLTDARRRWRDQLAGTGRLSLSVEQPRNRLVIRELRLSAADFRMPDWDDAEPGFCILVMEMSVQRRTCAFNSAVLAGFSLHSVARWHQRNFDISTAALTADMAMVAAAIGGIDFVDETKFSIPAAGGTWLGMVQRVLDEGSPQHVLAVRTFWAD